MKKKTNHKMKKSYVPMEIFRVKLNPEQAVLSCCRGSARPWGYIFTDTGGCLWTAGCGGQGFGSASRS